MNRTITTTHRVDITCIANRARIVLDMHDSDGDGFTLVVQPNGMTQFIPWINNQPASIADLFKQLESVDAALPTTAR